VPQVLQVASTEARQVISKAPKSAAPVTSSSPQEAIEAAKAMMALTSSTKPLAEAILENKAGAEQVACLHQALIAVTSWCITLVPMEASLLDCALNLGRRAQELSLPLHLPLYRSLATAIAQYSEEEDAVACILETANLAVSALKVTLQGSFFSDALLALVEKQQIKQAVELQKTMKYRYDIERMDMKVSMDILQALKTYVEARVNNPSADTNDDDDTMELFSMLRDSMEATRKEQLNQARMDALADQFASDGESLSDVWNQLDEFDEYPDDDDEEEDDDIDAEDMESMLETMEEIGKSVKDMHARLDDVENLMSRLKSLVTNVESGNDETGSMPKDKENSDEEECNQVTKEMLYLRDSSSWMLPDVTLQLVELNGGRDVFYTPQYEEQLIREEIFNYGDGYYD